MLSTSHIESALSVLFQEGDTVEIRIPEAGKDWKVSGYFNDFSLIPQQLKQYDGNVEGIYVTLNPVNPSLLARSNNKLKPHAKITSSDNDILSRRWFLVDFDAIRPTGISSTDTEHEAALQRARECMEWLGELGFNEPIYADSGNGAHLLYPIDLSNDDASRELLQRCLQALDMKFTDELVEVDKGNFNASRITKLYGTKACKGDPLPERPHRVSHIISVPDTIDAIHLDKLQQLAACVPDVPKQTKSTPENTGFNIEDWIREHDLEVSKQKHWQGGIIYELEECPWDPNHVKTARIIQMSNGALSFGCFHNSCQEKDWHALRGLLEPGWQELSKNNDQKSNVGSDEPQTEPLKTFNATDLGNAQRMVFRHGKNIRYSHTHNNWYLWDGRRWNRDDSDGIKRLAKETVKSIYKEASECLEESQRKELAKWAMRSESAPRIREMVSLAQSELGIPITVDDLDANPWLLNTLNGTVNLKTGELMPHSREHSVTKLLSVKYDPNVEAPNWMKFLNRIMGGNQDLIKFLQRAVGYSLTGDTSERAIFILYGSGANGKSTFLDTINELLGEDKGYAMRTPKEMLIAKHDGAIPNDIARLKGSRFVYTSEFEEGKRFAEAMIKDITGGEKITARFMRGEWFEFRPEFKIWLGTNHKPVIRGSDQAIWERIRLIPFSVSIPPEERVPKREMTEILRKEYSGILNWAIQGCLEWQREGLKMPSAVTEAVEGYRSEMDNIGNFASDCCIFNQSVKVQATQLYNTYKAWCEERGEFAVSQKVFATRINERYANKHGLENRRSTGGKFWWYGIGISEAN